jgi:hypothetical protein
MSSIKRAILHGFHSGNYTAVIELVGSGKVYLEDVTVARSVPVVEMVAGRELAVVFFDEHNARDAVVVAVYD